MLLPLGGIWEFENRSNLLQQDFFFSSEKGSFLFSRASERVLLINSMLRSHKCNKNYKPKRLSNIIFVAVNLFSFFFILHETTVIIFKQSAYFWFQAGLPACNKQLKMSGKENLFKI